MFLFEHYYKLFLVFSCIIINFEQNLHDYWDVLETTFICEN